MPGWLFMHSVHRLVQLQSVTTTGKQSLPCWVQQGLLPTRCGTSRNSISHLWIQGLQYNLKLFLQEAHTAHCQQLRRGSLGAQAVQAQACMLQLCLFPQKEGPISQSMAPWTLYEVLPWQPAHRNVWVVSHSPAAGGGCPSIYIQQRESSWVRLLSMH